MMKARMRTLYTVTTKNGTEARGDCPDWGRLSKKWLTEGNTFTETRVLWVGKPWNCACHNPSSEW